MNFRFKDWEFKRPTRIPWESWSSFFAAVWLHFCGQVPWFENIGFRFLTTGIFSSRDTILSVAYFFFFLSLYFVVFIPTFSKLVIEISWHIEELVQRCHVSSKCGYRKSDVFNDERILRYIWQFIKHDINACNVVSVSICYVVYLHCENLKNMTLHSRVKNIFYENSDDLMAARPLVLFIQSCAVSSRDLPGFPRQTSLEKKSVHTSVHTCVLITNCPSHSRAITSLSNHCIDNRFFKMVRK